MARVLLVVPPFIKYNAGPLLGPAMLQSAAHRKGHICNTVDLNALYILPRMLDSSRKDESRRNVFLGDHDKVSDALQAVEHAFFTKEVMPSLTFNDMNDNSIFMCEAMRRAKFGFLSHHQVEEAGRKLALSTFGFWASQHLELASPSNQPDLVGISLLHAGQVLPAVCVSNIARRLWPGTTIVWGGPHVSGLGREALVADLESRSFAADIFVTGHSEKTFTDLLHAAASGVLKEAKVPLVLDGVRGDMRLSPVFENLHLYDRPLTLPAQSTLGCAYGRCNFCTYPVVEPIPTKLDMESSVGFVAEMAHRLGDGTSMAIKDSLATPSRLDAIGSCIQNRVPWAACTKLSTRLDFERLSRLEENGLATLEVGLESLLDETQRRIDKIQAFAVLRQFVESVERLENLTLVVNYMVGFPWEDRDEAMMTFNETRQYLWRSLGRGRVRMEENTFELERLSPMARSPLSFGIGQVRAWPWASVLEYDLVEEPRLSVQELSSKSNRMD